MGFHRLIHGKRINVFFFGQGWCSTLEGFDGLMWLRNMRESLSPLHSEIEALIWIMECMRNLRQYHVTFETDCSPLVKMVSTPEKLSAFANYLEDIKLLQRNFNHSKIIHIPQTHNLKDDSLARSVCKQSYFIVHLDGELPVWFTESYLKLYVDDKTEKKQFCRFKASVWISLSCTSQSTRLHCH